MATLTDFDIDAAFDSVSLNFSTQEVWDIASDSLRSAAQTLKSMIESAAASEFTSSQASILSHIQDISIGEVNAGGGGTYYIDLYLGGDLSRPSLNSRSDGAYDIVGLFIHGWSPKSHPPKRVFGSWHGMTVGNRIQKDGMGFLNSAIDEFNSIYNARGIAATIGGNYG